MDIILRFKLFLLLFLPPANFFTPLLTFWCEDSLLTHTACNTVC